MKKIILLLAASLLTGCGLFQDEQAMFDAARARGHLIALGNISQYGDMQSVTTSFAAINLTDKTVKYVDYLLVGDDRVGGHVYGPVHHRITGPIEPGEREYEMIQHNHRLNVDIECIRASVEKVTYMDDTVDDISDDRTEWSTCA